MWRKSVKTSGKATMSKFEGDIFKIAKIVMWSLRISVRRLLQTGDISIAGAIQTSKKFPYLNLKCHRNQDLTIVITIQHQVFNFASSNAWELKEH